MLQITNYNLEMKIKQAYTKNILAKNVQKWPEKYPTFVIKDGYIIYKGFVYIALKIQKTIIKANHKKLIAEYIEVKKMLKYILRIYYFSEIKKAVQ